jgi:Zn-dependent protease with chaperone function
MNNQFISCPNGHQLPAGDSKFCKYCGAPLNAGPPPNQNQFLQNPDFNRQVPPNQYQQPNQNYPGQNNYAPQNYQMPINQPLCRTCGDDGRFLDERTVVCPGCKWLRPLTNGYGIDASAFQWAEDGKAMSALKKVTPLNAAAKSISDKVGRRWIEVTFNGVLLGEKQMPHIYFQAVKAARILGMEKMPDVYLSGERMWDCLTFGSDKDSFLVVGSALAGNFRGDEMLYLLAREMGHCRAGHALWKTVIQFFLGEQGPKKGFMAGGVFAALSPSALLGGAIEMPLLAWARQAEITADRAGLLAVGNEEIARKVLLSWSLKSAFIYKQINVAAWLEQQAGSEDDFMRLSELTTTSTPYITRRLKLLSDFANSPDLQRWQTLISNLLEAEKKKFGKAEEKELLRVKCAACATPMKIPLKILEGKAELPVRCPNAKCRKVTRLRKTIKPEESQESVS